MKNKEMTYDIFGNSQAIRISFERIVRTTSKGFMVVGFLNLIQILSQNLEISEAQLYGLYLGLLGFTTLYLYKHHVLNLFLGYPLELAKLIFFGIGCGSISHYVESRRGNSLMEHMSRCVDYFISLMVFSTLLSVVLVDHLQIIKMFGFLGTFTLIILTVILLVFSQTRSSL